MGVAINSGRPLRCEFPRPTILLTTAFTPPILPAARKNCHALSDADRPLTHEGIKKFHRAAEGLIRLDPTIDLIFSSPLIRARQTAEILEQYIKAAQGFPLTILISEHFTEPADLKALLAHILDICPAARGIAAIGHEPILSGWVAELCGQGHGSYEMKKGAVAGIELYADISRSFSGRLFMLAQPRVLRMLAR